MFYWDASAILALFIFEKATNMIRSFSANTEALPSYTTIITPLEVESAIQRRIKERSITLEQAEEVRSLASDFRKEIYLVFADQNVLDIALHLQKIYGLRVGDAIQLASARAGTEDPSTIYFLCLDEKLNEAAKLECFKVPFLG